MLIGKFHNNNITITFDFRERISTNHYRITSRNIRLPADRNLYFRFVIMTTPLPNRLQLHSFPLKLQPPSLINFSLYTRAAAHKKATFDKLTITSAKYSSACASWIFIPLSSSPFIRAPLSYPNNPHLRFPFAVRRAFCERGGNLFTWQARARDNFFFLSSSHFTTVPGSMCPTRARSARLIRAIAPLLYISFAARLFPSHPPGTLRGVTQTHFLLLIARPISKCN